MPPSVSRAPSPITIRSDTVTPGPTVTALPRLQLPAMTEPWPGRKVRVSLAGPAYQQAAQAHAQGSWISCEGDLVRQGNTTLLLNPRNLRILTAGAADTDTD